MSHMKIKEFNATKSRRCNLPLLFSEIQSINTFVSEYVQTFKSLSLAASDHQSRIHDSRNKTDWWAFFLSD